jgi:predicted transposase YbfD/YdcC
MSLEDLEQKYDDKSFSDIWNELCAWKYRRWAEEAQTMTLQQIANSEGIPVAIVKNGLLAHYPEAFKTRKRRVKGISRRNNITSNKSLTKYQMKIQGNLKRWQNGETIREIAISVDMQPGTLRKAFRRCFPAEYAEQVQHNGIKQRRAKIKRLRDDGLKAREIAKLCDVSIGTVYADYRLD